MYLANKVQNIQAAADTLLECAGLTQDEIRPVAEAMEQGGRLAAKAAVTDEILDKCKPIAGTPDGLHRRDPGVPRGRLHARDARALGRRQDRSAGTFQPRGPAARQVRQGLSVGIVGGGIGGLTAALSLLRSGFDVQVYEQAREFGEVGAGIQVSPNASRILHRLGLADALAGMGVRPLAWRQRRWDDGRTLLHTPLGDTVVEAFGFPHYQTHRADLLATLVRALPPERLHVGHRLTSFVDHGDRVALEFENGSAAEVDALVGADGIHSTVQRLLLGEQSPRFTGCVAYRGLIPAERVAELGNPGRGAGLDGPGQALRPLLRPGGTAAQLGRARRAGHLAARVVDRPGRGRRRARRLRGLALRRSGGFWRASTRRSSGRCSTVHRWSAGRRDGSRCSGTRATRCSRSWRRARPRRSRTAPRLTTCLGDTADVAAALRRYEAVRLPRVVEDPVDVGAEQGPLPSAGRARAGGARPADGDPGHRLVDQRGRLDLRARRRNRRRARPTSIRRPCR